MLNVLLMMTCSAEAATDIPAAAMKIPALVAEKSISTYVPSDAAEDKGLAVNIILPEKVRYTEGAPVVVIVPGGDGPDGLDFTMHTPQVGFAEIRFAFPGGGKRDFTSGGIYDLRGEGSQLALRDVLLFAAGKTVDYKGRHINQLVPVKLSSSNIGVVGWSNGGNIALVTMAKYAQQLQFISWIAFYESPIGSMFFPPNLGGTGDLFLNRYYRQGSAATGKCSVDYGKLAWQPDATKNPGMHKHKNEPEVPGVLFFDENKNGKWDESIEFALTHSVDIGLEKQIYPLNVASALELLFTKWIPVKVSKTADEKTSKSKVVSDKTSSTFSNASALNSGPQPEIAVYNNQKYRKELNWPSEIASSSECEAYFQERDGSLYIPQVRAEYPNLLVSIFASQIDHLQRQPDHPHIALQYNLWLENKVKWVRLNPEPIYVGQLASMSSHNFANNLPNSSIDSSSIDSFLEPEGLVPDYVFMDAAVAELADRHRLKQLGAPLNAVLVNYSNGATSLTKEHSSSFATTKIH